ncbi:MULTISPECIES: baseplate J/gp47 family protein [unclassified Microcoleus]|uniref:baseplate J/gp47 family protein n=1 Tax=unclassified Microcoleus TaxID=2642155 RepID=UPI002FD5E2A9
MSIPLPNLDDRTYAELVELAYSQIPIEYPEWTDRNPSDTGIILIELLAWLTEMLLYRVDRIPDRNTETFLKLLKGKPDWTRDKQDLETAIRETVLELRQQYRAVTPDDYERIILEDWNQSENATSFPKIKRARCLSRRNLTLVDENQKNRDKAGHFSIIVVPDLSVDSTPKPSPELCTALWQYIDERRLLTTRHHIVAPEYAEVSISANFYLEKGSQKEEVKKQLKKQIEKFFHPLEGGSDSKGWSFGRNVYISEVYALLNETDGIDYVETVTLKPYSPTNSEFAREFKIKPYELVKIKIENLEIKEG